MREAYGENTCHSWVMPNGRCCQGNHELRLGIPNVNCCDLNLAQGFMEAVGGDLGEVVARHQHEKQAFVHFAVANWDHGHRPVVQQIYSGEGMFQRGDHVELLAHDDLFVSVSLCPAGDFAEVGGHPANYVSWPIKVKVFEDAEGPLRTIPEPQKEVH